MKKLLYLNCNGYSISINDNFDQYDLNLKFLLCVGLMACCGIYRDFILFYLYNLEGDLMEISFFYFFISKKELLYLSSNLSGPTSGVP